MENFSIRTTPRRTTDTRNPPGDFQAGYVLLSSKSRGSVSVKALMTQEYMALREQNISSRQAMVSYNGPMTASWRLMV